MTDAPRHVISELGFSVRSDGEGLAGSARVVPEMYVPGVERLRTSVLAAWADVITGLLATTVMGPQVPVTLDLEIHLHRPAPACGGIEARSWAVKAGRTVFVAAVEMASGGSPLASGTASFMVAPDRSLRLPETLSVDGRTPNEPTISVPLAERARCERLSPGRARLHRIEDGLNSSNTVNGGLIALLAEEAALSLSPGTTLSTLSMRYLKPVRVGPVTAAASLDAGVGRIEIRDEGSDHRLAAVATTRTFASNKNEH